MRLIIDIPTDIREQVIDLYNTTKPVPIEVESKMIVAIASGKPISDNTTACDIDSGIFQNSTKNTAYDKCPTCANRNNNCQFGTPECHYEKEC